MTTVGERLKEAERKKKERLEREGRKRHPNPPSRSDDAPAPIITPAIPPFDPAPSPPDPPAQPDPSSIDPSGGDSGGGGADSSF
jgi:hypothetical protein